MLKVIKFAVAVWVVLKIIADIRLQDWGNLALDSLLLVAIWA